MERQAKDGTFYKQVGEDAWEPVTRVAKTGEVYKKVGADDWSPVEPVASQGPSEGKSALVGLQEGATFGARPFVAGVAGGLGQAVGSMQNSGSIIDQVKDLPNQFGSGFSAAKKEAREESDLAQAANPKAFMAGQLGGTLLTAPLTAIKGAQAAKGAKSLFEGGRQAARVGAAMGGAQALGRADDLGEAVEMVGSGALVGTALQGAGNAVSKYGKSALEATGRGARTIAANLTGIPEKTIETYAKRAGDVAKMMTGAGDDISEASDGVRQKITQEIQVARQKLNQQVGAALEHPDTGNLKIDGAPLLKAVEDQIAKVGDVTAKFRPGEISELKNVRDLIAKSLDETGTVSAKVLNELKQELQLVASPSYNGGQAIFPKGDLAARGAKSAGAEAKRLLDAAVPDLARANQQLSRLHAIEDNMNRNLIRAGKPESALIAAGSGANPRSANTLKSIDKITGGSAMQQAEDLAAAKTFGKVSLNPMDVTGKAVARMATGAGVGYLSGGEHGAMIGAAMTSPAALKVGLDAARIAGRVGTKLGAGAIKNAIGSLPRAEVTATATNQAVRGRAESIAAKSALGRVADEEPQSPNKEAAKPLKGRDKWANDGLEKVSTVIDLDPDQAMNDPKLKDLLVQASDLKPGSKAFDQIVKKIQSRTQKGES